MSALVLWTPPPALARAFSERHYCALQLAAHAEAKARAARMSAPCPIVIRCEPAPEPTPPPSPPSPAPAKSYWPSKTETYPYPHTFSSRQQKRQLIVRLEVASDWGISDEELIGVCRRRKFVVPRMIAMWFFRTILKMPLIRIGRALPNGNKGYARDHSTVCNAIAWVGVEIDSDPEFRQGLEAMAARIARKLADYEKQNGRNLPRVTQVRADPAGPS